MENKRGRKWARDEETGRCASKKVEKKKEDSRLTARSNRLLRNVLPKEVP